MISHMTSVEPGDGSSRGQENPVPGDLAAPLTPVRVLWVNGGPDQPFAAGRSTGPSAAGSL